MSDTSTIQPRTGEVQETAGHGRHRGQVSAHESETAPRGRHRKPVEQAAERAA
ncbi:hypothetical protein [Streptomyces sp. HUAS ZL42]|uniref:hypothetical protein n=1 Tax=Streptomyces sp. HUAS ZL42 TaxID=3231715 RepID=UPI00345E5DBF